MALYPDSNVYLRWLEGELPASRVLLSPCVVGPRIDVFENVSASGTYVASEDTTTWVVFDLPNYNPQYHKPVDYNFLNECGQTWISPLESVYIQDTDGVLYKLDETDYTFDYGAGTVSINPNIIYQLGSFDAMTGEVLPVSVNGNIVLNVTLEVEDSDFPYIHVNGSLTRVRQGDIVRIPYSYADNYAPSPRHGYRIYDNVKANIPSLTISSISLPDGTITFNTDIGNENDAVSISLFYNGKILYLRGTVGSDTSTLTEVRVGGDLIQELINGDLTNRSLIAQVYYITPETEVEGTPGSYQITWQTGYEPPTSGDKACIVGDLIGTWYVTTLELNEDIEDQLNNYTPSYGMRYGTVSDYSDGVTTFTLRGTAGSNISGDNWSIIVITYSAAWIFYDASGVKLYRRHEPSEPFLSQDQEYDSNHFFVINLNAIDAYQINTVPLALYRKGTNYLCSACEPSVYLWGMLGEGTPSTPESASITSVDIVVYGQNPSSSYIPSYTGCYILTVGLYDITPSAYSTGTITFAGSSRLSFVMSASDGGTYAIIPPEVRYTFPYTILRPLSGTVKVTYMMFNSQQPLQPIEITKYNDIIDYLGNIHPYNPLAFAAYLMYANRTNDTNTITFFAVPINDQSLNGYANALDVIRRFRDQNVVLYELVALTFNDAVHVAMQGYVSERSTPRWSDYRRYWKAVCLPQSYISKVPIGTYTIGAADNILVDNDSDFIKLNVQVGDYVETIPSSTYLVLSNANVNISANAAGFVLSHPDLVADSVIDKYLYFTDVHGNILTGKIVRKLSDHAVWVELDIAPQEAILGTYTIYIFRYWTRLRVVSIDSKISITTDGTLPTSPLIYRLYSQYSKEDIAEYWYSYAKRDNSERVMIVNPWIKVRWENTVYTLPGYFLAAAKAAQAAAKADMSEPLSGWPLSGILSVEYGDEFFGPDLFQRIYQNGIDIHMNESPNGPVISWRQRTTAQDITIQGKHEQSVVKVVDYLAHIFRRSVEPLTKKYNISQKVAEMINTALEIILMNAKSGRRPIIEPSSRLILIKPIKQPSDLPSDFQMANDIPFEPGYYIKTFIVHKTPIYRIQHEMYISQTEEG